MKKISILLLISFIGSLSVFAQQDAMFTHYMYNTLAVNPGYAGTRDALTATLLHRSQWVSFPGAPRTQTLTAHTPILKDNLGVGLSLLNDKVGPLNNTSVYIDLAYHLKVSPQAKLSFGLKTGFNALQGDLEALKLDQQADPAFAASINNRLLPNFGFGLYFHKKKYYLGLSTPRLVQNNYLASSTAENILKEKRHYFFIAGYVFNLTHSVQFKPTTFIKITEGAPVQADITGMFVFQERFNLGAMYRSYDAVGVLVGFNITNQFYAGYSFDWSFGVNTANYNYGSHEVMLRYDFFFNDKQRVRSPRYF